MHLQKCLRICTCLWSTQWFKDLKSSSLSANECRRIMMLPFLNSLLHKWPLRDIACRVRRWWLKGTRAVCGWYPGIRGQQPCFFQISYQILEHSHCAHNAWDDGLQLNVSLSCSLASSSASIRLAFGRHWRKMTCPSITEVQDPSCLSTQLTGLQLVHFHQVCLGFLSLVDADVLWGRSSAQFQLKKTPCQLSKRLFDWAPHIHPNLRWSRYTVFIC